MLAMAIALSGHSSSGSESVPVSPPTSPPFQRRGIEIMPGTSGPAFTLMTKQGGGFSLSDKDSFNGGVIAENGSTYESELVDGKSVAKFMPPRPTILYLAIGGSSVKITTGEGLGYLLGDQKLVDGTEMSTRHGRSLFDRVEYEHEPPANTHVFSMGEDGVRRASYMPIREAVLLGVSGFPTLRRDKHGNWSDGDRTFESGETVTTNGAGVRYRRIRPGGFWSARLDPSEPAIEGTKLVALSRPAGLGLLVDDTTMLPNGGEGDVTVDEAPHGTGPDEANFEVGLGGVLARLREDDRDTPANEAGTTLLVGDAEFPIDELLNAGSASFKGKRFAGEARREIESIRRDTEILIGLLKDEPDSLRRVLIPLLKRVKRAVERTFGESPVDIFGEEDFNAVGTEDADIFAADSFWSRLTFNSILVTLGELVDALSTAEAFAAAAAEAGGGVFEEVALTPDEAASAYGAVESEANAILGRTQGTRYGAVWNSLREHALAESEVKPGAFAYSIIEDTLRKRHLPSSGSAYYKGGTAATSRDGTMYWGDIQLLVHLRIGRVFGLVSNLTDTEGRPWTYYGLEVESILLPEARLSYFADWKRPAETDARASIILASYRYISEHPFSVFEGHLLGTGDEAGSEAVGVWAVLDQPSKSISLAGGFGAKLVTIELDPRPETDQEENATASVLPGDLGSPDFSVTGLAEGTLKLSGTLYGSNLETADPDDEIQLLDERGQRIEDTYEIPLEDLFSMQGSEQIYVGRNHVELAREEIRSLRRGLETRTRLDENADLEGRQELWGEIGRQLQSRLFGVEWLLEYPNENGIARDDKALTVVDDVLSALATPAALDAALEENSDGLFTFADGRPFRSTDTDDIWTRVESRIRLRLDSTEYTRFGAWRKQTSPNAAADYVDRLEDDENGPNSFAYSLLPQTTYTGARDRNFPGGGSATYLGHTTAVQGTTFYTGDIEIDVRWSDTWQNNREAGTLSASIRDMRSGLGDGLTYFESEIGEVSRERVVGRLNFSRIVVEADDKGRLGFSHRGVSAVKVQLADGGFIDLARSDTESRTASIDGKFVGTSLDGPLGAIGIWSIRDGGESKLGTGNMLRGAFGAELVP